MKTGTKEEMKEQTTLKEEDIEIFNTIVRRDSTIGLAGVVLDGEATSCVVVVEGNDATQELHISPIYIKVTPAIAKRLFSPDGEPFIRYEGMT